MTRMILWVLLALLQLRCANGPYRGNGVYGADEFVLDSYKIREGTYAIFEMQGIHYEELDKELLQEVEEPKNSEVHLIGMAEKSCILVDGKKRLFDVLSEAHLSSQVNLFQSYVVRKERRIPVDFYKLIKLGDMSQNIPMRNGDKIYLAEPSASSLMVMGEVEEPKSISVPDGFLSLREALAKAAGITYAADRAYIQVFRGSMQCPKIYTIHWQHVLDLPSDSLLLIPGDLVYVASTPLAQWHRFLSQLIPSLANCK